MSTDGGAAIRAEHVSFAYGRRAVLVDVSLAVAAGEMVALAGPNGSGKSTLLGLLSGIRRPAAGTVTLDGVPLERVPRREAARRIAVVPQETSIPFPYTVTEMVLMGRAAHRRPLALESAHDVAVAEDAMRRTGVDVLAARTVTELSGGERQRVIVARALAQDPSLLLLDEPTSHLDLRHAGAVLELATALHRRGVTVIAAMHDLTSAALYFPRLVFLREGRVVADGPAREVLTEASIRRVYDADAQVTIGGDGVPVVLPRRGLGAP